jgi:hypothetical protein
MMATVKYPKVNPGRHDRFAACNRLFRNALGERHAFINPRCRHLIWDLSNRAYGEDGREPNDSHPDMGHASDSWGYPAHYLHPVVEEGLDDGEMFVDTY